MSIKIIRSFHIISEDSVAIFDEGDDVIVTLCDNTICQGTLDQIRENTIYIKSGNNGRLIHSMDIDKIERCHSEGD